MDSQASGQPPELQLDANVQSSFIQFYSTLLPDDTIIRLFDRKGFYSAHGEAANIVARHLYKTTALVKTLGKGDNTLSGVTFGAHMLSNILHYLLVQAGSFRVEVYEGSGGTWTLTRSASPGRLTEFEEELSRGTTDALPDASSLSVAVVVGSVEGVRSVGVALADLGRRHLTACQFADDDSLCTLEIVLTQMGARECLVAKVITALEEAYRQHFPEVLEHARQDVPSDVDGRRLEDVLERCGMMITQRPKALFSSKNLDSDLPKLLREGSVEQHRPVLERSQAKSALAGVIAFAQLFEQPDELGKYTLDLYNPQRYMRLDAAAHRALHVMGTGTQGPGNGPASGSSSFSLLSLLNKAKSPMGRRLVKVWLKQPLLDLDEIRQRHDVVEAFCNDAELRERLRMDAFRGMPDVERLTRKLDQQRVTLADLCSLFRASGKLEGIINALYSHESQHSKLLVDRFAAPLAEAHDAEHLQHFENLIEAAIDLDKVPEEYLINATYNENLQELAGAKEEVEARIDQVAQDTAQDLGLELGKTIKLEWHKANNSRTRCFRITQKEEKLVRTKLNNRYQVIETRKDGTKFSSSKMRKAAEELQALSKQYDEMQTDLVAQVVGVAHTYVEVWERVAALLAQLDVLLGFAELACNAPSPYVRPTMLAADEGTILLKGARHPCVEAQEGGAAFIPNDCIMQRGSSWFQIITGPNMGGKSTFIRQVGVVVLMAQVGSFVSCDEATIALRDAIFARVGAGDCQLRGVSTFMAEMLESAAILKGATSRSLVIIDELGRGTSTYDGFGLAWAISEHLMETIGCPTLFATHFHELTALQGPVGVKNLHVETHIDHNTGKLCMLYQVKEGFSDQSFGIHVAEFAGFPSDVVELATRKAQELDEGPLSVDSATLSVLGKRKEAPALTDEEKQQVDEFLVKFKQLPLAELTPSDAIKVVKDLTQQLPRQLLTAA